MRIDIITIFPEMFAPVLNESILKRAQEKKKVKIFVHDLRNFSQDKKHHKVDDRPFGGGAGMIMCAQPLFEAVESVLPKQKAKRLKTRVIFLSPQGNILSQPLAKKLSKYNQIILICGRYEGIDERVREFLVDEEVSIGDYILTGGELASMVLVDCIVRLLPGVLGDKNSLKFESFEGNLLEYPQYTRPAKFRSKEVPGVLLSGDHKKIEEWRLKESLRVTKEKRPDLFKIYKAK